MKTKYLILLPMLLPTITMAAVSVKNGNYNTTFRDLQLTTQHQFEFDRTYNSKTSRLGWFGYGWGSLFETYITVMPDGSAIINEYGSGARTRYYPSKINADEGVQKIVSAIKEKDHLDDEQSEKLSAQLKNDEDLREVKVKNYKMKFHLADKTYLKQEDCSYGYLQKTSTGYKRLNCDKDTSDYFDEDGHLTQVQYPDGYFLNMTYVDGNPSMIKDNEGNLVEIKTNSDHLITEFKNASKRNVYEYSNKNLVKNHEDNGNEVRHEYDSNHNMTKTIFLDGSTNEITYDSPEGASAILVKNRDGAISKYQYNVLSKEEDQIQTIVTHFDNAGNQIDQKTYNLDFAKSKTGSRTLAAYEIEGESGAESFTKFDSLGRVIQKKGPTGIVNKYKYDEATKKLSELTQGNKTTKFFYDKNKNLIKAQNNEGLSFIFEYIKGTELINKVMINDHQTIREASFKYGANQKPVLIKVKNLGEIKITYDSKGEVLDANSEQGAKVSSEVFKIFYLILEVTNVQ